MQTTRRVFTAPLLLIYVVLEDNFWQPSGIDALMFCDIL